MDWIFRYLSSSIGKKQLLGLTGVLLLGFLFTHLAGNFLFFLGPDKFNEYSHMLISSPLIIPAEIGLVALFLTHIILAIKLSAENTMARPSKYALTEPYSSFTSKNMIYTGILVGIFLVVHVATMKFGTNYPTEINGVVVRDLYKLMVETFHNKGFLAFYIVCMIVMGLHLNHGIMSAFQTMGLNHPRYNQLIRTGSAAIAWGLALGFILIALFASFVSLKGAH